MKKIVLSGARPTGDLHLGNYVGALENWIALQDEYQCYYFIADWHALTTGYDQTEELADNSYRLMADFLACGLDPAKSVLFLQSKILEQAELFLLLGMITPLSWLERSPTYKDQLQQLKNKDIRTFGFLGYPCLQAGDILAYLADFVPVGEDQLPHLEITREIARRFNHLYKPVFPEPQALLTKARVLPGTDGRKMSKSYNNTITFADDAKAVGKKVMSMLTDPARIHPTDKGHPEICVVYAFHRVFNPDEHEEIAARCRAGTIGCVACKKRLLEKLLLFQQPIHEKRTSLLEDRQTLRDIIEEGSDQARQRAVQTLETVRSVINIEI